MSAEEKLDPQILLKKLDEIPSLPAVVYELTRIINDPMSSTHEVEAVMAQDIGMTTRVLKLANSAYYAIPGGVSSLARAIAYIGFDTVHQLVLASSIIKTLKTNNKNVFDVKLFWQHSAGVAIISETVAKYLDLPLANEIFTAGLVHDMGKMALQLVAPDHNQMITTHANQKSITFLAAEFELEQTPHTEIGRMLSERWKLPKLMEHTIKFHHEKDASKRGFLTNEQAQIVDTIYMANLLAHALKFGNSGHSTVVGVPNEILSRLMIDPQKDMPAILKEVKIRIGQAKEFIDTIIGSANDA